MNRFITDPENYTAEDLANRNWDAVRLNVSVDVEGIQHWYRTILDQWSDALLDLKRTDILREEKRNFWKEFSNELLFGSLHEWRLQWAVQRKDPIPFPHLADPLIYPEINDIDFELKVNTHLEQYYFGTYKNFFEKYKEMTRNRLIMIEKDSGLHPHTDYLRSDPTIPESDDNPELWCPESIRIHMQVQVDNDAKWVFGDSIDSMNREYTLEQGRIYLFNAAAYHSLINRSTNPWVIMYNNTTPDAVNELLKASEIIL